MGFLNPAVLLLVFIMTTKYRICLFDCILERHVCDSLKRALEARGHIVHSTGPIWLGHVFPESESDKKTVWAALENAEDLGPDVLITFRASTLLPEMVNHAKQRGIHTMVWFPDDPVLYKLCYQKIVSVYDTILHCGNQRVLDFYTNRHHSTGINFPFWTDSVAFPYCYQPEKANWDIIFLGNCDGQFRQQRYNYLASLPFSVRIFGRVDSDTYKMHGGVIKDASNEKGEVSQVFANARLSFSMPQYFKHYKGSEYDFSELASLGSFQIPSRIVQYAASGMPVISPPSPDLHYVFPEIINGATRLELISNVRKLQQKELGLVELSLNTYKRFYKHFSAQSRAILLEELLAHPDFWRKLNVKERTNLFLSYEGDKPSNEETTDSLTPSTKINLKILPTLEQQRADLKKKFFESPRLWRILFLGASVWGETDTVACLSRALSNLGHTVLQIDPFKADLLKHKPIKIDGYGPVYINLQGLKAILKRFEPQLVVCAGGGLCFNSEEASRLKNDGKILIGLTLSDPDVQKSMINHVGHFDFHGTNSKLALQRYWDHGLKNTLLFPFGIDRGYAIADIKREEEFKASVICMGHATNRSERNQLMEAISSRISGVRVYGQGWEFQDSETVTELRQMQALRSGLVHIDFPKTRAGYTNVKCGVFESIASGGVLCTEKFEEMGAYFDYGTEIVGYSEVDDLCNNIDVLLSSPQMLEDIRKRAFRRLVSEHLYENRWLSFFDTIEKELSGRYEMLPPERAKVCASLLANTHKRKKRVILSGFYGAENAGDELILRSISDNLTNDDSIFQVIAAGENPLNISKQHAISAFKRSEPNRAWAEVTSASAVILGGGGLWHDYTFHKAKGIPGLFSKNEMSITGYSKLPIMAKICGIPFHIFGLGVGPLNDSDAKQYARFLGELADSLTVRDTDSLKALNDIRGWSRAVNVAPDPVFALSLEDMRIPEELSAIESSRLVLGVNLRPWEPNGRKLALGSLADALACLASQRDILIVGVPMQKKHDEQALKKLFSLLPHHCDRILLKWPSEEPFEQLFGALSKCSLFLGMRLHANILAQRLGIPAIGIGYDPKVWAHFRQMECEELVLPLNARDSAIVAVINDVIDSLPHWKKYLARRISRVEKRAKSELIKLKKRLEKAKYNTKPLTVSYQDRLQNQCPLESQSPGSVDLRRGKVHGKPGIPIDKLVTRNRAKFAIMLSAPSKGAHATYSLVFKPDELNNSAIALELENRYENSNLKGRMCYECLVDEQIIFKEDIAHCKIPNRIFIYGLSTQKPISLSIRVRAMQNCEPWQWGSVGRLYIRSISLIPNSYKGSFKVVSTSAFGSCLQKERIENFDIDFRNNNVWVLPEISESCSFHTDKSGCLIGNWNFEENDFSYIRQDFKHFDLPPVERSNSLLQPMRTYTLETEVDLNGEDAVVVLWCIEYSDDHRLQHHTLRFSSGYNFLSFFSHKSTCHFRLAIRVSGSGRVRIASLKFWQHVLHE